MKHEKIVGSYKVHAWIINPVGCAMNIVISLQARSCISQGQKVRVISLRVECKRL